MTTLLLLIVSKTVSSAKSLLSEVKKLHYVRIASFPIKQRYILEDFGVVVYVH